MFFLLVLTIINHHLTRKHITFPNGISPFPGHSSSSSSTLPSLRRPTPRDSSRSIDHGTTRWAEEAAGLAMGDRWWLDSGHDLVLVKFIVSILNDGRWLIRAMVATIMVRTSLILIMVNFVKLVDFASAGYCCFMVAGSGKSLFVFPHSLPPVLINKCQL